MEQIVAAGGLVGLNALDTVEVYDISLDTWTTGLYNENI